MTPKELVSRFKGQRAVVLGDLMLDAYIFGHATRISPEAPVMVIKQESARSVPGGAANVALNLRAMGAHVTVIGTVGQDNSRDQLQLAFEESGVDQPVLVCDPTRRTTCKTRIVADFSHQVLRIDEEDDHDVSESVADEVLSRFEEHVANSDVAVLSDYIKGVLTPKVISSAVQICNKRGVPLVANPKPRTASSYSGATLVSLNRIEASQLLGLREQILTSEAGKHAQNVAAKLGVDTAVITLGGDGMIAGSSQGAHKVDAIRVEVADPAGAGDTVISTIALGVSLLGTQDPTVYQVASQLSASVVQHVGVAVPSEHDLKNVK